MNMQVTLLKGKLHQARVTDANPDYDGSCAIDSDLLALSGIIPFEQIHVYNITNGERLITYAINGEAGSGIISMNGAAALKARAGDRIIICAYAQMTPQEAQHFVPKLVYLDQRNAVVRTAGDIAIQMA